MAEPAHSPEDARAAATASPALRTAAFPLAAETIALALLYFCLAWVSIAFARDSDTLASVWSPSAVLLGVLLQSGRSHWLPYAAAALIASTVAGVAHDISLSLSLGLAAGNIVDAVLAAYVLRRMFPHEFRLTDFRQLVALFAVATGVTAAFGAVIAGFVFYLGQGNGVWRAWLNWWLAGGTGVLVICPLLLTWRDALRRHAAVARRETTEAVATIAASSVLIAVIFSQSAVPLLFPIFPLAIWTAFRFGVFLTAFLCLSIALIGVGMTWLGYGPIAALTGPIDDKLRLLQSFIAILTSICLTIAIAWERSRKIRKDLQLSEQRFRDFAESTSDRCWETDKHHRYTWISRSGRFTGRPVDALIGKSRIELAHGDRYRDEIWRKHYEDLDARRAFRDFHYEVRGPDDRIHHRRVSGKPIFDENGEFHGYRGTVATVTQSVETELLVTQLGRIIEESLNEIYVIDASSMRFILVNRGARQNLGYTMDELREMSPTDICVAITETQCRQTYNQLDIDNRSRTVELVHRRKDGTTYDVEAHLQRVTVDLLPPVYVAVVLDITRRKKTHAELAAKSLLLETTLNTMAQGICVYDKTLHLAAFNQKYIELLGFAPDFVKLGDQFEDHLRDCAQRGLFGPGDVEAQVDERLRTAQQGLSHRRVYRRGDGRVIVAQRRPMPSGGFVTTFADITERQAAEEALRRTTREAQDIKASFEAAIKASRQILYDWNTRDDSVKWDGETESILGYTATELEGLPDWMELIHPDDHRAFVRERAHAVMAKDVFSLEYRVRHKDGRYIPVADRGVFLHGTQGDVKRIVGFISDISAQKTAEEALRQSDKLLAVGQLTGGIAHDFNNLLAIIHGNLELLNEDLGGDAKHQRHIQTALTAAGRGAALTQRLLAFARKQPLQPQSTRVNRLIDEMSDLLQRSLDPSIDLEMALAGDLWLTCIDPGGLENALLNLALNARDAMPKGGKLIIETRNVNLDAKYVAPHRDVEPGDYVMLSVTDTGHGMPPEVRDRAFEPFFTTKGVGRGNGLGLPMVYGFVKQSHGHVQIDSELGVGTSVRLFLPRDESEVSAEAEPVREIRHAAGGGERVLVVEDNDDVRNLTNLVLTGLGYRTVLASDGHAAIEALAANPDVDVLFTDVVLPGGLNGFELAQRARDLRPDLKVLYTSGYTNNAIMQGGVAEDTVVLLSKPYRKADLAVKMRQVLAAKETADGQQ